jgi:hypothetical protein
MGALTQNDDVRSQKACMLCQRTALHMGFRACAVMAISSHIQTSQYSQVGISECEPKVQMHVFRACPEWCVCVVRDHNLQLNNNSMCCQVRPADIQQATPTTIQTCTACFSCKMPEPKVPCEPLFPTHHHASERTLSVCMLHGHGLQC